MGPDFINIETGILCLYHHDSLVLMHGRVSLLLYQ